MSKKNYICRVTTKRLICGDLSVCYAIFEILRLRYRCTQNDNVPVMLSEVKRQWGAHKIAFLWGKRKHFRLCLLSNKK